MPMLGNMKQDCENFFIRNAKAHKRERAISVKP